MEKGNKKPFIENRKFNAYLKYSGLGFQLIAVILAGAFAGRFLDRKLENETPYFTAGLIMFFLIAYLVKLVRDLNRENKTGK